MRPQDTRRRLLEDPVTSVYAELMSHIIAQIPSTEPLDLLVGPGNAQASFYFRSPATGAVNANLFNNLLAPRIEGLGETHGIRQATTTSSVFLDDYAGTYLKLRYALSTADRAEMDRIDVKVKPAINRLRPQWNKWVDAAGRHEEPPVPPLDRSDVEVALIEMTAVLQTRWIDPAYIPIVRADPAYPYVHLDRFDEIFRRIPGSVPDVLRAAIRNVYAVQGAAGALTARVSRASQTLRLVIRNVQHPTAENGGLPLTDSPKRIPGVTFRPVDPEELIAQLSRSPPKELRYTNHVTRQARARRSADARLSVETSAGGKLEISAREFFSMGRDPESAISIFNETFAGSEYSVEMIVRNPTLQPILGARALPLDLAAGQGWMEPCPIEEAIRNEGRSDVTGFVFDGPAPPFRFGENGDFGVIQDLVVSQWPEIYLEFENCNADAVEGFFRRHAGLDARFLGLPIPVASKDDRKRPWYAYEIRRRAGSCVVIEIRPSPPGYVPPSPRITSSLCFLVAVNVDYPVAGASGAGPTDRPSSNGETPSGRGTSSTVRRRGLASRSVKNELPRG